MALAPAVANALTIATPIPVPPPVMRTTLPATESSGRFGSVAGVGSWLYLLVGFGNSIFEMCNGLVFWSWRAAEKSCGIGESS